VQFIPAVGLFVGQALSSRDTTGFDWVNGTTTGHTPRYSYSEGATFGGSAGLTIEVPIYRWFAARASVAELVFSGAPLEGDRTRTTLGAGLAVWVGR
jgi:outer membrane protein TolC